MLIAAMAGVFPLVALVPSGRRVFDLRFGSWEQTLTALAVAGCAAVAWNCCGGSGMDATRSGRQGTRAK